MESSDTLVRCIFRSIDQAIPDDSRFHLLTNQKSIGEREPCQSNAGARTNEDDCEWVWLFYVQNEDHFQFKLCLCLVHEFTIVAEENLECDHEFQMPTVSVDQAVSIILHWNHPYESKIISIDDIINENEDLFEKLPVLTGNIDNDEMNLGQEFNKGLLSANIGQEKPLRISPKFKIKVTTESLDSICGSSSEVEEIMSHQNIIKVNHLISSKRDSTDPTSSSSDRIFSDIPSKVTELPEEDEVFACKETEDGLIDIDKLLLGMATEDKDISLEQVTVCAPVTEQSKTKPSAIVTKIQALFGFGFKPTHSEPEQKLKETHKDDEKEEVDLNENVLGNNLISDPSKIVNPGVTFEKESETSNIQSEKDKKQSMAASKNDHNDEIKDDMDDNILKDKNPMDKDEKSSHNYKVSSSDENQSVYNQMNEDKDVEKLQTTKDNLNTNLENSNKKEEHEDTIKEFSCYSEIRTDEQRISFSDNLFPKSEEEAEETGLIEQNQKNNTNKVNETFVGNETELDENRTIHDFSNTHKYDDNINENVENTNISVEEVSDNNDIIEGKFNGKDRKNATEFFFKNEEDDEKKHVDRFIQNKDDEINHDKLDTELPSMEKVLADVPAKVTEQADEDEIFACKETEDGLIDIDKLLLGMATDGSDTNLEHVTVRPTVTGPIKTRPNVIVAKIQALFGFGFKPGHSGPHQSLEEHHHDVEQDDNIEENNKVSLIEVNIESDKIIPDLPEIPSLSGSLDSESKTSNIKSEDNQKKGIIIMDTEKKDYHKDDLIEEDYKKSQLDKVSIDTNEANENTFEGSLIGTHLNEDNVIGIFQKMSSENENNQLIVCDYDKKEDFEESLNDNYNHGYSDLEKSSIEHEDVFSPNFEAWTIDDNLFHKTEIDEQNSNITDFVIAPKNRNIDKNDILSTNEVEFNDVEYKENLSSNYYENEIFANSAETNNELEEVVQVKEMSTSEDVDFLQCGKEDGDGYIAKSDPKFEENINKPDKGSITDLSNTGKDCFDNDTKEATDNVENSNDKENKCDKSFDNICETDTRDPSDEYVKSNTENTNHGYDRMEESILNDEKSFIKVEYEYNKEIEEFYREYYKEMPNVKNTFKTYHHHGYTDSETNDKISTLNLDVQSENENQIPWHHCENIGDILTNVSSQELPEKSISNTSETNDSNNNVHIKNQYLSKIINCKVEEIVEICTEDNIIENCDPRNEENICFLISNERKLENALEHDPLYRETPVEKDISESLIVHDKNPDSNKTIEIDIINNVKESVAILTSDYTFEHCNLNTIENIPLNVCETSLNDICPLIQMHSTIETNALKSYIKNEHLKKIIINETVIITDESQQSDEKDQLSAISVFNNKNNYKTYHHFNKNENTTINEVVDDLIPPDSQNADSPIDDINSHEIDLLNPIQNSIDLNFGKSYLFTGNVIESSDTDNLENKNSFSNQNAITYHNVEDNDKSKETLFQLKVETEGVDIMEEFQPNLQIKDYETLKLPSSSQDVESLLNYPYTQSLDAESNESSIVTSLSKESLDYIINDPIVENITEHISVSINFQNGDDKLLTNQMRSQFQCIEDDNKLRKNRAETTSESYVETSTNSDVDTSIRCRFEYDVSDSTRDTSFYEDQTEKCVKLNPNDSVLLDNFDNELVEDETSEDVLSSIFVMKKTCANNKFQSMDTSLSSNVDSAVVCDSDSQSGMAPLLLDESYNEFISNHPMTTSQTVDSMFVSTKSCTNETVSNNEKWECLPYLNSTDTISVENCETPKSRDSPNIIQKAIHYSSLMIPPKIICKQSSDLEKNKVTSTTFLRSNYVNDDDLFPDSVTPTKADSTLRMMDTVYDIPYIDDESYHCQEVYTRSIFQTDRTIVKAHLADCDECTLSSETEIEQTNRQEIITPTLARKTGRKIKLLRCCSCLSRIRH